MSLPADYNAAVAKVVDETTRWVRYCLNPQAAPQEFNALERWMAVDEYRRLLVRELYYAQRRAASRKAGSVLRSAQQLWRRARHLRLRLWIRRTCRLEQSDAYAFATAMRWLRHLLSYRDFDEAVALTQARFRTDARLNFAFCTVYLLWTGVLDTKRELILAGVPGAKLPRRRTLTYAKLRRLDAELGSAERILRLVRHGERLGAKRLSCEAGQVQTYRELQSTVHLAGQSEVHLHLSLTSRELYVLSGEVCLVFEACADWPCEIQIDDLRLRGRAVHCVVRRHAPGCAEIYVINGALEVLRVPPGEAAASGEPIGMLAFNDHVLLTPDESEVLNTFGATETVLEHRGEMQYFFAAQTPHSAAAARCAGTPSQTDAAFSPPAVLPDTKLQHEAQRWVARLEGEHFAAQLLNELRTWLAADRARVPLLYPLLRGQRNLRQQMILRGVRPTEDAGASAAAEPRVLPTQVLTRWRAHGQLRRAWPEAWALLQRAERAQFSASVLQKIEDELQEATLRYVAYWELLSGWSALLELQKQMLSVGWPAAELPPAAQLTARALRKLLTARTAAAVTLRRLHYTWPKKTEVLQCADGEPARHTLSGSDELTLNTSSQVKMLYSPQRRWLRLLEGELYLQAQAALAWPVELRIEQFLIRSSGAAFGVRRLSAQCIEVYVLHGTLQLTEPFGTSACALMFHQNIWLKKNQWLRIGSEALELRQIDGATLTQLLAWQTGAVPFRETPAGAAGVPPAINRSEARKTLSSPIAAESTAIPSNDELETWAQCCAKIAHQPLKLHAFERWLAEDEHRLPLLWARIDAASSQTSTPPLLLAETEAASYQAAALRARQYLQRKPWQLSLTQKFPASDAQVCRCALLWLRHLLGCPDFSHALLTLNQACSVNLRLNLVFSTLYELWDSVFAAKLHLILSGVPSPPLPPPHALSVRKLKRIEADLAERTRIVRAVKGERQPYSQQLICQPGEFKTCTNEKLHWIYLSGASELEIYISLTARRLRLLSGTASALLCAYAGWPWEIQVDDLRLRCRGAYCLLRRHGPGCLEIYMVSGALKVFRASPDGDVAKEVGITMLGFNDHALITDGGIDVKNDEDATQTQLEEHGPGQYFLTAQTRYSAAAAKYCAQHSAPATPASAASLAEPVSEDVQAQAARWAERLTSELLEPQLLNDLRTWLAADAARVPLLRGQVSEYRDLKHRLAWALELPRQALTENAVPATAAPVQRFAPRPLPVIAQALWMLPWRCMRRRGAAFALLQRAIRDEFREPVRQEIYRALQAHPLLYVEYRRLLRMWSVLLEHQKEKLIAGWASAPLPRFADLTARRLQRLHRAQFASAEVLRRLRYEWRGESATYTCARGAYSRHSLPGGDALYLNTQSKVRVDYTPQRREFELVEGEIYLHPWSAVNWPLSVRVNRLQIDTADAFFGVRRYSDRHLEVYVAVGSVLITAPTGSRLCAPRRWQGILVTPNQRLRIDGDQVQLWEIDDSTLSRLQAWQSGEVAFYETPLSAAIAEYNRYLTGPLLFVEPALGAVEITGRYPATDPAALLKALRATHGIHSEQREREGAQTTVLYKPERLAC